MSVALGEIEVTSKKLSFKLASENTIKKTAGWGINGRTTCRWSNTRQ